MQNGTDQDRMCFLFTMLDNPPALPSKRTAKLVFPSRTILGPAIRPSGGARRDRTDDLMLAKHALSQLSYGPILRRRVPRVSSAARSGLANLRFAWANADRCGLGP